MNRIPRQLFLPSGGGVSSCLPTPINMSMLLKYLWFQKNYFLCALNSLHDATVLFVISSPNFPFCSMIVYKYMNNLYHLIYPSVLLYVTPIIKCKIIWPDANKLLNIINNRRYKTMYYIHKYIRNYLIVPVSYTHLDVYKRQAIHRFPTPKNKKTTAIFP